ncbi:unnamed protein product [Urochloa humidicola]
MGLNPPVPQQDSNWEIRVAVLLSLLLQVLLIFLGPTRKRSTSSIPRSIVWSCYLLADWVADLALGLILNNMGNIGGGGNSSDKDSSSPIIFAFWTPFLLLHLGGPDTITAYSVEDNELWLRHLIGLLFELFSACVIFFCSFQGNPMIHATMLMFVVGIIKYAERTYSLYSGSVGRLRDSMMAPPVPGPDYAEAMGKLDAREKAGEGFETTITAEGTQEALLELEMLRESRQSVATVKSLEVRAYEFFLIFRRVFVDVVISFQQRMKSRAFFVEQRDLKPEEALEVMQLELGFMYDTLHTKAPIAHTWKGWVLRSICSSCLVSALVIFFLLDKPRHQVRRVDVGITYALLLGGLALDAAAVLIMLLFSNRATVFLEQQSTKLACACPLARLTQPITRLMWRRNSSWSRVASQMNLIRYCLEKPGPYSSSSGAGGARKNRRWLML